jgi:hypothetical protein
MEMWGAGDALSTLADALWRRKFEGDVSRQGGPDGKRNQGTGGGPIGGRACGLFSVFLVMIYLVFGFPAQDMDANGV